MVYWIGDLTCLKQGPGATPHCVLRAADSEQETPAIFATWGREEGRVGGARRRPPSRRGIDVRLAQLLGRPAVGAWCKQAGS